MKSISQTTQQMESISKKTSAFFRRYHVGQILRAANACKLKGFSSILVFLVLVSIIFENRSLYMQRRLHEDSLPFGKDTAYRFLNSCHTNWRKFTLLLGSMSIQQTEKIEIFKSYFLLTLRIDRESYSLQQNVVFFCYTILLYMRIQLILLH